MPDDLSGRPQDGRLNLEQQKKRAKELLRALGSGDPGALARLDARHPRSARLTPADAKLADAQLVLARENGFDSWPRLKDHVEALVAARDAMNRPDAALDTEATLHIRCGSDIKGALRRAGFVGGFHEFSDPFCQGPVRDLPFDAFLAERAAFVAQAFGMYPNIARARLVAEYGVLERLGAHDRIALWFEHDSYDQLILAFLLQALRGRDASPLLLICVDRAPGVGNFHGLGQLAPEVIRLLWSKRQPITAGHFDLGARVWAALTSDDPRGLDAIARAGTPAVPPMAAALARHLQELPSACNGLSLTEQLALDLIAETGVIPARNLFARLTREFEPLPFLGDAMFWPILRDLAAGGRPLIVAPNYGHHDAWPEREISLTAHGDAVRRGDADRLAVDIPVRWVGGVEIKPGAPTWRWDAAASRLVKTSGMGDAR